MPSEARDADALTDSFQSSERSSGTPAFSIPPPLPPLKPISAYYDPSSLQNALGIAGIVNLDPKSLRHLSKAINEHIEKSSSAKR